MKHELSNIIQSEVADFFAGFVEIHTELGGPNSIEEAQTQLSDRLCALLAAHEQEPVTVPNHLTYLKAPIISNILANDDESPMANAARILAVEVNFWRSVPLFTHPAPSIPAAVPEEATPGSIEIMASIYAPRGVTYQWDVDECNAAADAWNACRAAMLQSEPVSKPYKLPDGYALVPIKPTEDMVIHGFESEPSEGFSETDAWEAYEAMSGCQQAAHRAELCWAAMIAAAPKGV